MVCWRILINKTFNNIEAVFILRLTASNLFAGSMRNAIVVVPTLVFNDRAICIVSIFSPIPQSFKAKIAHFFAVTQAKKSQNIIPSMSTVQP